MDNKWDDYMNDYYNQDDEYQSSQPSQNVYGQPSNGTNGDYGEPRRPKRNDKRNVRRIAGITAAVVLFGVVTGGTIGVVNLAANRFVSNTQVESTEATEEVPETPAAIADQNNDKSSSSETEASAPVVIGNDVSGIVKAAMPSVVAINNRILYETNSYFFGPQTYQANSSGSGIILGENDTELLVVTNNHVVEDSSELKVTFIDGTSVDATVKGTDSDSDLAIVSIPLETIPAETLDQVKTATLGDSDELEVGQGVVAIGNALGYGQSVTVGYVSALNREVNTSGVTRTLLQTDAAINPGNSGGALLNMKGEVIGINAAKYSSTDVEGVGYAIPISFAQNIIEDLMTKSSKTVVDEERQGYLGIQLQNIDSRMAKLYGMPQGIYVYKIVEGGAASKSTLRERDIITKFDGLTVKTGADLQDMLTYYEGGTTVTLTVQSLEDGAYVERAVDVTLDYRKDHVNTPSTQE